MNLTRDLKLQIVGGGRMGHALVSGLLDSRWASAGELGVVDVEPESRSRFQREFPGLAVSDQPFANADTLLAVKPYQILDVCRTLDNPGRVVSIAAGIRCETIESALMPGTPVIRVMPNTPALVGAGAAGVAGGSSASVSDITWAEEIMSAVGLAVVVDEDDLDVLTALSGSGPAYVFLLAEALSEAAVAGGLSVSAAGKLTAQTIYGAGKLLMESDASAGDLRRMVTTPGGTTEAALEVFESGGLRSIAEGAVRAAAERSRKLAAQEAGDSTKDEG